MVREDVISTKTISSEEELNSIFRIENDSIVSNENSNKTSTSCNSYDKNIIESPSDYEIREILFGGLIDIETWNKIKHFERDNPDKIRRWREEDGEKMFHNRSSSFLVNRRVNKRNDKKGVSETCENKIIKICLSKYPKSKFVLSVSEYYKRYGRISEKQMDALKNMIGK